MITDIISVSGVTSPFQGDLHAIATRSTGAVENVLVDEVRGAAVPAVQPAKDHPGYCLFLARVRETNDLGQKPLMVLSESVVESQDELVKRVLDEITRFKASIVYAEQPEIGMPVGFWGDLLRATRGRPGFRLKAAPSVKDVDYGLNLVMDAYRGEGLIRLQGENHLRSQMRSLAASEDPRDPRHVAFHALRYLLAGFRRDRLMQGQRQYDGGRNEARRNPGGWT